MELLLTLVLGTGFWLLGLYLNRIAAVHHARRLDARDIGALQHDLEVLQLLQKHRALGAQHEPSAVAQRCEIARGLDGLWQARRPPLDGFADATAWPPLRKHTGDFDGHCQLIEALLCDILLLELQLASRGNTRVAGLGQACRALEDLGRLRGLAVRAAQHPCCPLELQVQMRYLCQRIRGEAGNDDLGGLLERLDRQLISAASVALKPAECFALITPIIDARLQGIRQGLG